MYSMGRKYESTSAWKLARSLTSLSASSTAVQPAADADALPPLRHPHWPLSRACHSASDRMESCSCSVCTLPPACLSISSALGEGAGDWPADAPSGSGGGEHAERGAREEPSDEAAAGSRERLAAAAGTAAELAATWSPSSAAAISLSLSSLCAASLLLLLLLPGLPVLSSSPSLCGSAAPCGCASARPGE